MSLRISGHAHCYQCMRFITKRSRATRHRNAKCARRKQARFAARDEIAAGIAQFEAEREEASSALVLLRRDADSTSTCDSASCACRARQRAAREELAALGLAPASAD